MSLFEWISFALIANDINQAIIFKPVLVSQQLICYTLQVHIWFIFSCREFLELETYISSKDACVKIVSTYLVTILERSIQTGQVEGSHQWWLICGNSLALTKFMYLVRENWAQLRMKSNTFLKLSVLSLHTVYSRFYVCLSLVVNIIFAFFSNTLYAFWKSYPLQWQISNTEKGRGSKIKMLENRPKDALVKLVKLVKLWRL